MAHRALGDFAQNCHRRQQQLVYDRILHGSHRAIRDSTRIELAAFGELLPL